MSKHTSAPWGIGQNAMGHWMITAEESEHHRGYIATLATTNTQSETNARLIAAAPEMLDALREFMGDFVSIVTAANHNDLATIIYVAKACQKEISELLKKVEGEV
jgi:hypothetical protein